MPNGMDQSIYWIIYISFNGLRLNIYFIITPKRRAYDHHALLINQRNYSLSSSKYVTVDQSEYLFPHSINIDTTSTCLRSFERKFATVYFNTLNLRNNHDY